MMKILLTGATGFVGKALCTELYKRGHALTVVTRSAASLKKKAWGIPCKIFEWHPEQEEFPASLDGYDAVYNLLGESVAGKRWTLEQKRIIRDSRVTSTQRLAKAIGQRQEPLPVFISASAIGYYPFDLDGVSVEGDAGGEHFLAEVCRALESAAAKAPKVLRCFLPRLAVVLGADGGALPKMRQPFDWGVGGVLGSGAQKMSWIHIDDLVQILVEALADGRYSGPVNCVAPEIVTNLQMSRMLAEVLDSRMGLAIPSSILRLALGERAIIVLGSQAVRSARLQEIGFRFRYPELRAALSEACSCIAGFKGGCRRFSSIQFIPQPLPEVFAFFADPRNLERITPPLLSFKIKNISSPEIEAGTIINYRLKVHGVPMKWRTLIKEWNEDRSFVDFQEAGPYDLWHHTHSFTEVPGGTLMEDQVRYRLPFGAMGDVFGHSLVRRDVQKIFAYRREAIEALLGSSLAALP